MSDTVVRGGGGAIDTVVLTPLIPALVIEVFALTPIGPMGPVGPPGPAGPPGLDGADGFIPEPAGPGSWGRLQTAAWNPVLPLSGDTMTGDIGLTSTQPIDGGVF